MEHLELKRLQESIMYDVIARISEANNATSTTRLGELNTLHIAANMNIEKTTQSLNNILLYKKELAIAMLKCSDEQQIKIIAEGIKYSDNIICKILGINK
jgi:hypothetical protein